MLTEFVGLQLSREELKEIRLALLEHAMVSDEVRKEKGDETEAEHPLLERIEALLAEPEEVMHMLDHRAEDELWEFAWYSFTDEWAWYRAKQEVEKRGFEQKKQLSETELESATEAEYRKNFELYVSEIGMQEPMMVKAVAKTQTQRKQG